MILLLYMEAAAKRDRGKHEQHNVVRGFVKQIPIHPLTSPSVCSLLTLLIPHPSCFIQFRSRLHCSGKINSSYSTFSYRSMFRQKWKNCFSKTKKRESIYNWVNKNIMFKYLNGIKCFCLCKNERKKTLENEYKKATSMWRIFWK